MQNAKYEMQIRVQHTHTHVLQLEWKCVLGEEKKYTKTSGMYET